MKKEGKKVRKGREKNGTERHLPLAGLEFNQQRISISTSEVTAEIPTKALSVQGKSSAKH